MKKVLCAILLLVFGVITYWLFNPEIFLFDFFQMRNPNVIYTDSAILLIIKNHFADAAWCLAIYILADYLNELRLPPIYVLILYTLPILSEVFQAIGIVDGTFDWIDILIYSTFLPFFLLKTFPMKNLKQHCFGFFTIAIAAFGLIASKASKPIPKVPITYSTGTFVLQPKQDDIFTKPSLAAILNDKDETSVVLRVPASEEDKITEAQKQINNSIYSTIEKEFAKAGYLVRDRAMFAKALGDEDVSANYSEVHKSTGTDLILELVSYGDLKYNTNKYIDEVGNQQAVTANFTFTGTSAEFKLISVKDNDLVGSYTFYYTPCVNGCKYKFDSRGTSSKLYTVNTLDSENFPYEYVAPDVLENFFKECSIRLIKELKNTQ